MFLIPTGLALPSVGLPFDEYEELEREMWTPFPAHAPYQTASRLAFNEHCKLNIICWQAKDVLRPNDKEFDSKSMLVTAERLLEELEEWYEGLPGPLMQRPNLESGIVELQYARLLDLRTM